MPEFKAEDWDVAITEEGTIEYVAIPGREQTDQVIVPRVVVGFNIGVILEGDDKALVLSVTTSRGETIMLALEPRTVKSLTVGLVDALERDLT